MNVTDRIKAAAEDSRRKGERPTKVHLTVDDGRKLQCELIERNDRLSRKILKEGVRHAVHKVDGLEVVWRSPEFGVE